MSNDKIKWHPAFTSAIQLELKEYEKYLDYAPEHQLTQEPLRIDIVIIKNLKEIIIEKSIGKLFKKYNIIEYKSPRDYVAIDDYYKVKAYAYLYKVLSGETNSIDLEEITITLTSLKFPRKLGKYLESRGIQITKKFPGIYYVENTDICTQLLVISELSDQDTRYLKLLQFEHKNRELLTRWLTEYINNIKDPLYAIIMDALTESNPNELMEVFKNMGMGKLSEDNRIFLMDAIKKLELDKQLKKEAKIEDARNFLKLGVSIDIVIKATGLSEEEVLNLKE